MFHDVSVCMLGIFFRCLQWILRICFTAFAALCSIFSIDEKKMRKKINQKRKIHLVLWQRFMNITYWSAYLKWRAHWANAHDNTFIHTLHNYEIDQRQPPSSSSTDSEKSIAETVHLRFSKTSTWMRVSSKTHIKRDRERARDLAKEKI